MYNNLVDKDLKMLSCNLDFNCNSEKCNNNSHRKILNECLDAFKQILFKHSEKFKFDRSNKVKLVPGWNDYCKEKHCIARYDFLNW